MKKSDVKGSHCLPGNARKDGPVASSNMPLSMVLSVAAMGRISMATRNEPVAALAGRSAASSREERGRILDEFTAVSGLHRKHAMRLLRAGRSGLRTGVRPERCLYNEAVREALLVLWEASDRVCGNRLRAQAPIPGRSDGTARASASGAGSPFRFAGEERRDDRLDAA